MIKIGIVEAFELRKKVAELAMKQEYEEDISKEECELLSFFDELNTKKSTSTNVANFFELLEEVLRYASKQVD